MEPMTINLDELRSLSKTHNQGMDDYYKSIGYVKVGDKYVKDPNFMTSQEQTQGNYSNLQDQLNIQKLMLELDKLKNPGKYDTSANTPSPAQKDTMSGYDTTLGEIGTIRDLLKDQSVDTGRSQVLKGFMRNLLGPTVPGLGQSDNEQKINALMGSLKANFIKSLSGTQVSDKEAERLKKLLPDITDTRQEIENKLSALQYEISSRKLNLNSQFQSSSNGSKPSLSDIFGK